ncbi:signal peptidase II [Candidatus Woesearchaeota archaeon CG_4_10_14_0_8_um_filter_47_5]|nr:MAG: signal peptidase II [Candidatus Woesearchaeota archaeon CG_4_10_14_0_8_um_filter_47_5]
MKSHAHTNRHAGITDIVFIIGTALACVLLDQGTKYLTRISLALHEPVSLIPGILSLTSTRNTGAAFGMFKGQQASIIILSLAALGLLGYWCMHELAREGRRHPLLFMISCGLIMGGIIGNLIDRVMLGYVTDMIDVGVWPVFNVADMCLSCGVGGLIIAVLGEGGESKRKQGEHFVVRNIRNSAVLTRKAKACIGALCQGRGLMFSRRKRDFGLVFIFDCEKYVPLHMWFVGYPIDVIFLSSEKEVVEMMESFRPFSYYRPKKKARYIIELPDGTVAKTQTSEGDKLSF